MVRTSVGRNTLHVPKMPSCHHCPWCQGPLPWGVFVLEQKLKSGAHSADKSSPIRLKYICWAISLMRQCIPFSKQHFTETQNQDQMPNTSQPEITQAELLPGYSREKEKEKVSLLCGLSGTVTNNWDKHFRKRKGMMWLTVAEAVIYNTLAPLLFQPVAKLASWRNHEAQETHSEDWDRLRKKLRSLCPLQASPTPSDLFIRSLASHRSMV